MDFKDVVILGGGILIAVVIWHGLWTAWRSRRDPLRMELAPELSSEEIDEMALVTWVYDEDIRRKSFSLIGKAANLPQPGSGS